MNAKVIEPFDKTATAICDNCGKKFQLMPINLQVIDVVFENGDKVKITQLVCPSCHTTYPVQLDNQETESLLTEIRTLLVKQYNLRKNKLDLHKKQEDKIAKMQERLKRQRKNLASLYNGQVYQYDGGSSKLEFKPPVAYAG